MDVEWCAWAIICLTLLLAVVFVGGASIIYHQCYHATQEDHTGEGSEPKAMDKIPSETPDEHDIAKIDSNVMVHTSKQKNRHVSWGTDSIYEFEVDHLGTKKVPGNP